MQINIIYTAMSLYNFIKFFLENKKNIYYTPTNIFYNTDSNNSISNI